MCNTEDLMVLTRDARKNGFAQAPQIDEAKLDPAGSHLLWLVIFGHNMDATTRPLHHRVQGLLKAADMDEGVPILIDVRHDVWERLHDYTPASPAMPL